MFSLHVVDFFAGYKCINVSLPRRATLPPVFQAFAAVRFIQGTISDHPTSLLIDLPGGQGCVF